MPGPSCVERRHRRMAERAVRLARHARQIGFGDGVADERPDHIDGDLGVRAAGEARDGLRRELRPGFRHIKTAVAGETRERDVNEAERRGLAAGGNVLHEWSLERRLGQ